MTDLAPVIARFQQKLQKNKDFKAKVLFDLGADGVVFADSTVSPPVFSTDRQPAPLTLTLSLKTLMDLLDGKLDPNLAFMMRKLKVTGPLPLALKLNALLEE